MKMLVESLKRMYKKVIEIVSQETGRDEFEY